MPARGVKTDAVVEAMRPELERLKTEDITDEELARFKTRAKADLIRSLDSNEGLAEHLANYHTLFGDWRELFRYVDRIDAVTKADIRKAAAATFVDANRTVGRIETAPRPREPRDDPPAAGFVLAVRGRRARGRLRSPRRPSPRSPSPPRSPIRRCRPSRRRSRRASCCRTAWW